MTPNLFIVGAPKCGTSSLFDWLTGHPDIRGSRMKEPFFLTDPAHPLVRRPNLAVDGIDAYAKLFSPADAEAPVRMEGTTHYLFDPVARDAIAAMDDVRVIIVLREPAARIYSSFSYTANNLARLRPGLSFARYLDLLAAGDPLMPEWCTHAGSAYVLEREIEYSRYHSHVAPWLRVLGHERVRVLIMEEMVRDPGRIITDLLGWLGLDPEAAVPIGERQRNRTENVRLPRIQSAVRYLNARIRPPEAIRIMLKEAYGTVQYRAPKSIEPGDAQAVDRLRATFVDDNAALSQLTGIDLRVWGEVGQDRLGTK